jgi:hypothetical protein
MKVATASLLGRVWARKAPMAEIGIRRRERTHKDTGWVGPIEFYRVLYGIAEPTTVTDGHVNFACGVGLGLAGERLKN